MDVLSREVTKENNLKSTRLILKRGQLPKWLPKHLIQKAESWVIEESTVDPCNQQLSCKSYNIDHVKLMRLIETTEYKGLKEEGGGVVHNTDATVISSLGGMSSSSWMDIGVNVMRSRIENYAINRFKKGLNKQRLGFIHILNNLKNVHHSHNQNQLASSSTSSATSYSSFNYSTIKNLNYRIRNWIHSIIM